MLMTRMLHDGTLTQHTSTTTAALRRRANERLKGRHWVCRAVATVDDSSSKNSSPRQAVKNKQASNPTRLVSPLHLPPRPPSLSRLLTPIIYLRTAPSIVLFLFLRFTPLLPFSQHIKVDAISRNTSPDGLKQDRTILLERTDLLLASGKTRNRDLA